MNLIEESLSNMIFTLNTPWDFSEVTLSMKALAVLIEINGTSSLGKIGKKLSIPITKLEETVNDLGRLNLIKLARPEVTLPKAKAEPQIIPHPELAKPVNAKPAGGLLFRGVRY